MLLKLSNITKHYGTPGTHTFRQTLAGINLDLQQGDTIAIVGPSGSGKTTLLNLIGALDQPSTGEIIFDGIDLKQKNSSQLAQYRNHHIGFVFQLHHLLPQCTLIENVLIPTLVNTTKAQRRQAATRAGVLLERVGVSAVANQLPSQLSGGECQRAALVRALINQPRLLLCDEPTGSLDSHNADQLADLLIDINKEEGTSLVVVTHSLHLAQRMTKTLSLVEGKLEG